VQLINAGAIQPGLIVTHRFPLAEHAAAFAALTRAEGQRGKVMLEVTSHRPSH
jgi:threonine dehydrogenase-like Zn-dependent dehydrogenase